MKTSTVPTLCGIALAAMCTAGLGHWWSVHQFAEALKSGAPMVQPLPHAAPTVTPPPVSKPTEQPVVATNSTTPAKQGAAMSTPQKEFFEALLAEVKTLRSENLNLVDQMAETNRDLMKLEFRVDTHSESFRPLPVSEERSDTSFDDGPGVLPPRAEPVFPQSGE
jgi:hypothetical protein